MIIMECVKYVDCLEAVHQAVADECDRITDVVEGFLHTDPCDCEWCVYLTIVIEAIKGENDEYFRSLPPR